MSLFDDDLDEIYELKCKVIQLEKILRSYRIQYKSAMKAQSLGLCKRVIKHAIEDDRAIQSF